MKQVRFYSLSLLLALCTGVGLAWGDVYRVDRRSQWQEWQFPAGVLELRADGSVVPKKFEGGFLNAALDAAQFSHEMAGGKTVQGGVWKVGSTPGTAGNIIDGDSLTFWKPDPAAPLEDWWIDVDLGRTVPVTKIRLIFPDREGTRPFREFRVFGANGNRGVMAGDVFSFHLMGGTTTWNDRTEVEYEVRPFLNATALTIGDASALSGAASGVGSTDEDSPEVLCDLVQYIRFRADTKSSDAALSEVEVYTFGENIALGTLERGGSIVERVGLGSGMADGDANTYWIGRSDTEEPEPRYVWDLGGLFWIERIAMFSRRKTSQRQPARIANHQLLGSDGRLKLTGALSYDLLFDFDVQSGSPEQLTYLFSPPRPIRYLSNVFRGTSGEITEVAIFPVGHIARVEMTSDNIDLGEVAGDRRSKVIESLDWEADLPPGARVQAQTRSGNTLQEVTLYFHKSGKEISEAEYKKLPPPLRGDTKTIIQHGEDWSNWSTFYHVPGEEFRSPSPRRYVQVRLLLSSARMTTAPTIRSLSINYTDALMAESAGEIHPKTALPGVSQTFSYRILPRFKAGDSGFDRILFETPSPVDSVSLSVRIGGREVRPAAVHISADSLVVELAQVVRRDTVEVDFDLTITRNPTFFRTFVGNSQRAGLWQPVDPAERFATMVFLPAVPETDRLIANLSIQPPVITPNGDGVGDQTEIRFSAPKAEQPARVRIYALTGTLVRELEEARTSGRSYLYLWSGRDGSGVLVPPGNYLCQIGVEAQAGEGTLTRVISVVY